MSKARLGFSRLESVNSNKLGLRFVLFKMWNSPRFCFNSYLELNRRMRMRARCAAWQLWVSEKFSLLINARPVYTRSTPKTHFRDDTMKITNWFELPVTTSWVLPWRGTGVYHWSAGTAVSSITVRSGWFLSVCLFWIFFLFWPTSRKDCEQRTAASDYAVINVF